jgi:hypothetical protein
VDGPAIFLHASALQFSYERSCRGTTDKEFLNLWMALRIFFTLIAKFHGSDMKNAMNSLFDYTCEDHLTGVFDP